MNGTQDYFFNALVDLFDPTYDAMLLTGRTFRVFVSSTFDDFKVERNALQERVFPKLRELCLAHGARWQAIDLRWGVSSEASLDQQALSICLAEVARCQRLSPRPNFIVLLGDRYGWQPAPPEIPEDDYRALTDRMVGDDRALVARWYALDRNNVPPSYRLQPRDAEHADPVLWSEIERRLVDALKRAAATLVAQPNLGIGASATEREIDAGTLTGELEAAAPNHVFAFLRSIDGLPNDKSASVFRDIGPDGRPDAEASGRLARLKQRLYTGLGDNVFNYPSEWLGRQANRDGPAISYAHINRLCDDVYDALRTVILTEIEQLSQRDPTDVERDAHAEFGRERRRHFIGRGHELERAARYLSAAEAGPTLLVTGAPGSGKSALLAEMVERTRAIHPDTVIVERYIGATSKSTNGVDLLRGLCAEIALAYDVAEPGEAGNYSELVHRFAKLLGSASSDRPLMVFVDALDQLPDYDPARDLAWLPFRTGPESRIAVSFIPEALADAAARIQPGRSIALEPLLAGEGSSLLDHWLADAGRMLTSVQRTLVLDAFGEDGRPLYLRVAFELARRWRSHDNPHPLARSISGIFTEYIGELADRRRHGPLLTGRALGFLAAAKHGIAEDEMLDLLAADNEVFKDFLAHARHELPAGTARRRLPVVVWSRLHIDLEPFITERMADGTLVYSFYHGQFRAAAAGTTVVDMPRAHAAIAHYFEQQPLKRSETHARTPNLRKLSEQPFQEMHARHWAQLEATLASFAFVDAKVRALGAQALVEDYEGLSVNGYERTELSLIGGAVRLASHVIDRDPELLASQLCGRLVDTGAPLIRGLLDEARALAPSIWLRPVTASLERPGGACLRILDGYTNGIMRASWSIELIDNRVLLTAGPAAESTLKLWNVDTGAVLSDVETPSGNVRTLLVTGPERAITLEYSGSLRFWDLRVGVVTYAFEFEETKDSAFVRLLAIPRLQRNLDRLSGGVRSVALSTDKTRVAGGLADGTVRVWDAETAEEIERFDHSELPPGPAPVGMAHEVAHVEFCTEGRLLTQSYRRLKLWDLATGTEIHRHDIEHPRFLGALLVTSDGPAAVFTVDSAEQAEGSVLRVWDLDSGRIRFEQAYTQKHTPIALVPGGRLLAAGWRMPLRVLDLATGANVWVAGGPVVCRASALTRDGRLAVIGDDRGGLSLWDLSSGRKVCTADGHSGEIQAIRMSGDDRRMFTASEDNTVRVWDFEALQTGATLPSSHGVLRQVAVLHDEPTAVAAHFDGTVSTWDVESGQPMAELGRHGHELQSLIVAQTDLFAATGDDKGFAKIWDLSGKRSPLTLETGKLQLTELTFSKDGGRLAVALGRHVRDAQETAAASRDVNTYVRLVTEDSLSWAYVYDVGIEREVGRMRLSGHPAAIALSEDGRLLVTASEDVVELWLVDTGALLRCYELETDSDKALAVIRDFSAAACVVKGPRIAVIDLVAAAEPRFFDPRVGSVAALHACGAPGATRLVVVGSEAIRMFDLATLDELACFGSGDRALGVAFSPGEAHLAAGFSSGTIKVWSLSTMQQIARFTADSGVGTLAISGFGPTVVAGDHRGSMHFLRFEGVEPKSHDVATCPPRADRDERLAAVPDERERLRRANALIRSAGRLERSEHFDAALEQAEAALELAEPGGTGDAWASIRGEALARVGQAQYAGGDVPAARETFERARKIVEPLAATRSDDAPLLKLLATIWTRIGFAAQASGDFDAALAAHTAALAAADPIADIDPGDKPFHELRAQARMALGEMLDMRGDAEVALEHYLAAVCILDPFASRFLFDTRLHRMRIHAITSCTRTAINLGRFEQAEFIKKLLDVALVSGELLERYGMRDLGSFRNLAQAKFLLARVHTATNDTAAAFEACRATIALIESWPTGWSAGQAEIRHWSEDAALLEIAANARLQQGYLLQAQGEIVAATQSQVEALAIADALHETHPAETRYEVLRASILLQLGNSQQSKGELAAALATLRDAASIVDHLLVREQNHPVAREQQANIDLKIGEVLAQQGDIEPAASHISNVVMAIEPILKEAPTASWLRLYATAQMQWGYLANAQGDRALAIDALRAALANVDALAESTPDDPKVAWLRQNILALKNQLEPHSQSEFRSASRPGPADVPIPNPATDPNRATALNIEYQKKLADWKALPWWQRVRTKRPEPPHGI
ncbi:MAG: AAA family ATPase [Candidatus Thiodiazotropha sp.]